MVDAEIRRTELADLATETNRSRFSSDEADALVLSHDRKDALTIEAIREAATNHFKNTGNWPNNKTTGNVPGMPGETWSAIDGAGRYGCRGLQKGKTLSAILKPLKQEYGSKIRGTPLTVESIRKAALIHFENTGNWPSMHTSDEPPGLPGERWQAINQAARNGCRHLRKGQSLAEILKPIKEEYGTKIWRITLTVDAIQRAAIKHFEKTGVLPSANTNEEVPGMPGETWTAIDQAARNGYRHLPKGQSLAEILKPIKEKYGIKVRGTPLTVELIQDAATRHFENTGKWPSVSTPDEVPGMPREKWRTIDLALHSGLRGLKKGQSLSKILKPLREEYGSKIRGTLITVEMIREAAIKLFEQTGNWPSVCTPDEVPGMPGEKWANINSAGQTGGRGLQKGQTLSEILRPLKDQLSINIAITRLPRCFVDAEQRSRLSSQRSSKIRDKNIGALFKESANVTFTKGEAFEQLAGLLLLTRHEEDIVIPQYCLVVAPDRGYYGMRADYRAGNTVYEIKWGGATANIQETFEKHMAQINFGGKVKYNLIMLCDNTDVSVPYSTFAEVASGTYLENWLQEVQSYLETLVEHEKREELATLRNYLYGLVMRGNTFTGKERLEFLTQELTGLLDSDSKDEYARSHRYALYCPLSAHFEHEGRLYAGTITPHALQVEQPEQYKSLYSFGRLVFEDPLDRDIAVMCELSSDEESLSAESILRKETGLVESPTFYIPAVGALTKAEIPDLETLKKYLHFVEDNFEFGLEYIAYFGSRA